MKKILSLGLFIIICCGFMVGCKSRMSDEEMDKYCDYESDIESMYIDSNQIKKRVDEYIEKFDIPDVEYILSINSDDLENYKDSLKESNDKLNNMDINKFKIFYENAHEYRGTNKKEEQDNYEKTQKKIFSIKRNFAYYSEIISYILDDKITESKSKEIKQLQELSLYHIDNETLEMFPTRFTDEDIKKQNNIYEKYNINEEELNG
ncbi:hypothetical protein [Terrisporobacter sp.]|uniref:hypothetical protein n=1 Tax=Terrisporobacter sp. TaxID=1965305 RepID=UPI0028979874|nr:hypothetical protein [Terrisporobacter sp.]